MTYHWNIACTVVVFTVVFICRSWSAHPQARGQTMGRIRLPRGHGTLPWMSCLVRGTPSHHPCCVPLCPAAHPWQSPTLWVPCPPHREVCPPHHRERRARNHRGRGGTTWLSWGRWWRGRRPLKWKGSGERWSGRRGPNSEWIGFWLLWSGWPKNKKQ